MTTRAKPLPEVATNPSFVRALLREQHVLRALTYFLTVCYRVPAPYFVVCSFRNAVVRGQAAWVASRLTPSRSPWPRRKPCPAPS